MRSPRALSLLRPQPHYRAARFAAGLRAAGFTLCTELPDPRPGDVVVSWNRYGYFAEHCARFERAGALALIVENAYLAGAISGKWHAMALGRHAGLGTWVNGGPERWDALGVGLAPWRTAGGEVLIIGQRSIGEPGVASPHGWEEAMRSKVGGRIRPHPGRHEPAVALEDDLRRVSAVVTWGSSAAFAALLRGIPVWYGLEGWIGARAARPVSEWGAEPKRDDAARLAMFRRLAWAQWRIEEIEDGSAFHHLLGVQ